LKIRQILTAGAVIATVGAAAFAAQSPAGAATSTSAKAAVSAAVSPPRIPGLQVHVLNLHSQFERATQDHLVSGPRAGIIPMLDKHGAPTLTPASSTPAACAEPNCDLSRHGGQVQHSPKVYLLLWGPDWGTSGTNANAVGGYLAALYYGLGQTSYDHWSTITSQYSDSTGHPTFGSSVRYSTVYNDSSTPPATVTPADIADEAAGFASGIGIRDTADAQVTIAFESGTCFSDGFGGDCGSPQSSGYCAWHSAVTTNATTHAYLPYTNLPWQLDAGAGCGANFVNSGNAGLYDGWSMVGGHEFAEAVTDPNPPTGYIDTADERISGGEIGDKCAWGGQFGVSDPYGNVTLPIGGGQTYPFAMQSLWSNAVGKCVMNGSLSLSVTTPATQRSTLGHGVSLQIHATVGGSTPLSYAASGLPAGLSINRSTGVISGTPGVTAGTYSPRVTVSYYAGSKTVGFSWQVSSAAGPVKGYASKCVDDTSGRITSGNKIQIWTCNGGAAQRITFTASRQLQVVGRCITGGSTAYLEPCSSATNENWTRLSNGEYVLKSNGRCLTEPSTTNGKQLTLAACRNTANQHWSLP
jgi:hypothetical protein